jgi:hypothetical protein
MAQACVGILTNSPVVLLLLTSKWLEYVHLVLSHYSVFKWTNNAHLQSQKNATKNFVKKY